MNSTMKNFHSKKSDTPYRFEKADIRPHDIFYAEHYSYSGAKIGHYFYCVHSQDEDKSNELFRDILALLITTKETPGYNVEIRVNGKRAWVCCDNPFRLMASVENIDLKPFKAPKKKQLEIMKCMKSFEKEKQRQLRKGLK